MKILVINAGSSSLKYQLIDMESERVMAKGLCERIGIDGKIKHESDRGCFKKEVPMKTHGDAIGELISAITGEQYGCISSLSEISAVGHRVLHAGEKFSAPALVNDSVIAAIEECIPLGPLHNPANLIGINACMKAMPGVPQVAVFDTAFHQTMPEYAYLYGLPYEYYEKYKIRRYGFHGTSHKYVTRRTAKIMGKPVDEINLIACHLGNGSSVTAVKNGKCVDTSMGLTPLDGMLMGTRCGGIDPAIVCFLGEKEGMTYAEMDTMMNKKSGVLGVSGVSSDFRDLEAAADAGNRRAQIALQMFSYQVRKFVGAYIAVLGRVDAIVFTAGIGENNGVMRCEILRGLEDCGIVMDEASVGIRSEAIISKPESKIKVYVVPTNEELMIARDTKAIAEGLDN